MNKRSIYDFTINSIEGKKIKLSDFEGKPMILVNTASECGFTSQYQQLQELYEMYKGDLVVIGFPSNDFGGQEPGTDETIKTFCETRYGVKFPLSTKIKIVGPDMHPLFKWLTNKTLNQVFDDEVKWNFYKFLISPSGQLEHVLSSSQDSSSEILLEWLPPTKS
jgi:glutathione peroxidase